MDFDFFFVLLIVHNVHICYYAFFYFYFYFSFFCLSMHLLICLLFVNILFVGNVQKIESLERASYPLYSYFGISNILFYFLFLCIVLACHVIILLSSLF